MRTLRSERAWRVYLFSLPPSWAEMGEVRRLRSNVARALTRMPTCRSAEVGRKSARIDRISLESPGSFRYKLTVYLSAYFSALSHRCPIHPFGLGGLSMRVLLATLTLYCALVASPALAAQEFSYKACGTAAAVHVRSGPGE